MRSGRSHRGIAKKVERMHGHFNGLKTAALFGGMGALVIGASVMIFGNNFMALAIGLVIAVVMNFATYFNSDKLAIKAMRAYPVTEAQQPAMYRMVREMSSKAGKPMPALYVSPTSAPNAFATGRNEHHAAVCCTEGILHLLDERELRGVLAHELAHIYHRDILISCVASTLASVVTALGYGAMFFGGHGENRPHPLATMLLMMVGPIAASIIHMAISRTREFDADERGARLTGDPIGLANALEKLERGTQAAPLAPEKDVVSASSMMIANPFRPGEKMASMFSTHPPMGERIARLHNMADR